MIKSYKAKVTGTHAMTGIDLVAGEIYNIEETLAGPEVFELVNEKQRTKNNEQKKEVTE